MADLTQAFETIQKELVLILSVIYYDLNKHVTCLSDRTVNYLRTRNINDILFNKIGHKLDCILTSPLFGITQYKVIITKSNKKKWTSGIIGYTGYNDEDDILVFGSTEKDSSTYQKMTKK